MKESDIQSLPEVGNPTERKLCLLLPQYKSTHPLTLYSIISLWDRRRMSCMMHFNDAFIINARNTLAHKFVTETTAEWALFVDDDMILPTGNAPWMRQMANVDLPPNTASVNAVDRLLSHGKTLVGGLYFVRAMRGNGKPCYATAFSDAAVAKNARKREANVTGLQQTDWVGTGCLLVHRDVFLSIQAKFPHLAPDSPTGVWRYFSPTNDYTAEAMRRLQAATTDAERTGILANLDSNKGKGQAYSGEDVVFCRRAKAAGHQPYVDLDCICGHIGSIVWSPKTVTD